MNRPLVDPKSFELAEHFLNESADFDGGLAPVSDDEKWKLAKVIQDAVEGWFANGPSDICCCRWDHDKDVRLHTDPQCSTHGKTLQV